MMPTICGQSVATPSAHSQGAGRAGYRPTVTLDDGLERSPSGTAKTAAEQRRKCACRSSGPGTSASSPAPVSPSRTRRRLRRPRPDESRPDHGWCHPPIYELRLEELDAQCRGEAAGDDGRCGSRHELRHDYSVGTPSDNGSIDQRVVSATRAIGTAPAKKPGYHVVVVKSTVVPGTTDQVVLPLLEESTGKRAGPGFGVGVNPSSRRRGKLSDFMASDRLVLADRRPHSCRARGALQEFSDERTPPPDR